MKYKIGSIDLSEEQYKAATNKGNTLVVAGPGSGKTRTLLARALYLLEERIPPEKIIILTFTLKTVHELKERLRALGIDLQIETFHALAFHLCRLLNKNPYILEEKEKEKLLKELALKIGISRPRKILKKLALIEEINIIPQEWHKLYTLYQEYIQKNNLWDYSRLLKEARNHPLKEENLHILVDEFQDLSPSLVEFLKTFSKACFFLVGDPAQAIYGFRGGDPYVAQKFIKDIGDFSIYSLSISFRVPQELLSWAEKKRKSFFGEKPLRALRSGGKILGCNYLNPPAEAQGIAKLVAEILGGLNLENARIGIYPGEIAILARVRSLLPPIHEALRKKGIPVKDIAEEGKEKLTILKEFLEKVKSFYSLEEISKESQKLPDKAGKILQSILKISQDREEFFFRASLLREIDLIATKDKDKVSLLTIHEAKGLEFKSVILAGAEEGILPFRLMSDIREEEEERLAYVALTRSAKNFFFTWCNQRFLFGKKLPGKISPYFQGCPTIKIRRKKRKIRQSSLF